MKSKRIILVGMMGAGKSAISKELSKNVNLQRFELDEIFENKYMKISSYFEKFGENSFRQKETEILKEVLKENEFIISTGGGIILKEENRRYIFEKKNTTIYLKAAPETIFERIKYDTTRPLLKVKNPLEEIKNILQKRQMYYKMADITIDVDNKNIKEITEEIWKKLF